MLPALPSDQQAPNAGRQGAASCRLQVHQLPRPLLPASAPITCLPAQLCHPSASISAFKPASVSASVPLQLNWQDRQPLTCLPCTEGWCGAGRGGSGAVFQQPALLALGCRQAWAAAHPPPAAHFADYLQCCANSVLNPIWFPLPLPVAAFA